jgi:uncharacterized protein (TIGR04255 family)
MPVDKGERLHRRLPVRLKKEPLLEALWEIRFTSAKQSVAELLPGMVFNGLPGKYPNTVRLPTANIPAELAENDPNLRYVPRIRLQRDNHAVQIGEHVISLNIRRPYSGWPNFSAEIHALIDAVRKTDLVDRLERFSLKYIDLIDVAQPPDLGCLNVRVELGGQQIGKSPVHLRTEAQEKGMVQIVQIASPATALLPQDKTPLVGVLLDTDTICQLAEGESWDEIKKHLDAAHTKAEELFFSLLTDDTLAKLGAEYEE